MSNDEVTYRCSSADFHVGKGRLWASWVLVSVGGHSANPEGGGRVGRLQSWGPRGRRQEEPRRRRPSAAHVTLERVAAGHSSDCAVRGAVEGNDDRRTSASAAPAAADSRKGAHHRTWNTKTKFLVCKKKKNAHKLIALNLFKAAFVRGQNAGIFKIYKWKNSHTFSGIGSDHRSLASGG